MHPCDPPQEREDGLHILAPPTQRAVELVEDQKARLQALEKMIDLIAGAGQAAPARGLWRAQSGQDAGVEMRQARTFPGLDHPHLLLVGGTQMFDGEAFGDHGLAVMVGTGKQQTAWAQGWRSLKQQSHRVMRRAGRRMADPARRAHMGDPHCVIGLQEWDGGGHEVVRHLTNPRLGRPAADDPGRALPGPRRKA